MADDTERVRAAPASIAHWIADCGTETEETALIGEEPLSIRIQGQPYVVVMRTPGEERAHAAGLCLGEGIVDVPADIAAIAVCDGGDTNVVTVTLSDAARGRLSGILDRREWVSQTSCGICGKQLVADLHREIAPVSSPLRLPTDMLKSCVDGLTPFQRLRALTRASHGAALYDAGGGVVAVSEDVGRHNALDKAVGSAFLSGALDRAAVLALSSRISYELVQKAARARIPFIVATSLPTALAVNLADALGICLLSLDGPGTGLLIYTHHQRLRQPES